MNKGIMRKGILIYADYFDATTSSLRAMTALKPIIDEVNIFYWARTGAERTTIDPIFEGVKFCAFTQTAKPRSLEVIFLFVQFQIWILRGLIREKKDFVIAFTFYTIFPALVYKFFINRKCKVIYDPRDYVANTYRINRFLCFILRFCDNVFIRISDFVIFPDRQYFNYYGMFKLSSKKYFILPNSTSDRYNEVKNIDIYKKFHIPKDKLIIPVLGYFSENRGEKILFDCIKRNVKNILFVFAGDIRDQRYLDFFEKHKNILFLGRVPYLDALAIMKNAVLVPQLYDPKLKNNAYAFPTKYYDCLMVGTPIVVSKGQIDVATEIKENHFGWIIDYEDSESLMQIIQDYSKSSEGVDKKKFREYFLKKYDYSIFEIGLRGAYDSLLRVQD